MTDETFQRVIDRIEQMRYALVQLETGIRLSKEMHDKRWIESGDVQEHLKEVFVAHRAALAKIENAIERDFCYHEQYVMVAQ